MLDRFVTPVDNLASGDLQILKNSFDGGIASVAMNFRDFYLDAADDKVFRVDLTPLTEGNLADRLVMQRSPVRSSKVAIDW